MNYRGEMESLPKYKHPPVRETAMSVTFQPTAFAVPHFGLFWGDVKDEFTEFEVHPVLARVLHTGSFA